jgi:hypothetical protein
LEGFIQSLLINYNNILQKGGGTPTATHHLFRKRRWDFHTNPPPFSSSLLRSPSRCHMPTLLCFLDTHPVLMLVLERLSSPHTSYGFSPTATRVFSRVPTGAGFAMRIRHFYSTGVSSGVPVARWGRGSGATQNLNRSSLHFHPLFCYSPSFSFFTRPGCPSGPSPSVSVLSVPSALLSHLPFCLLPPLPPGVSSSRIPSSPLLPSSPLHLPPLVPTQPPSGSSSAPHSGAAVVLSV